MATARLSSSAEADGEELYLSVVSGLSRGASDFSVGLEYLDREPIWARDRSLTATANGPIDARSQAGNPGTFITSLGPVPDAACPAESLSGPFCLYDFAPDVTLIPAVERVGAFGEWDYAVNDSTSLFARAMYSLSDSERDLAAAPNAYPVSAANPNNPFGEDVLAIYRLTELGPRRDRFETDSLTLLAGVNGTLRNWQWEFAVGTSTIDTQITGVNGYALAADVQTAIDAGTLNVFGDSPAFDPASVSFETERDGESVLTFADVRFSGTLSLGGFDVSSAFGLELRAEDFEEQFDPRSEAGDVIGVGGISADGDRTVRAAYAEFGLPLTATWDIVVAGRYDDYSDFGGTFNPKLSTSWAATETLTLHASLSTGFKAPALHELYAGDILSFENVFDTTNCDAAQAASDAAAIARYCDAVFQVTNIASGNRELDAEESDTFTTSVVWEPTEQWQVQLDYWQIDNKNAVVASPQFYVDNEARFAGNVVRNGSGDITTVLSPFQNVASQETWGVDGSVRSEFEMGQAGTVTLSSAVSYLGSLEQAPSPGEPAQELAGVNGTPEWRARGDALWSRDAVAVNLAVHYVGDYTRQAGDDEVDAFTRVDLQGRWAPAQLQGGEVSLGLDNVFDEEPPEDPFLSGWPFFNRALHDVRGRFFYLRYRHTLQ